MAESWSRSGRTSSTRFGMLKNDTWWESFEASRQWQSATTSQLPHLPKTKSSWLAVQPTGQSKFGRSLQPAGVDTLVQFLLTTSTFLSDRQMKSQDTLLLFLTRLVISVRNGLLHQPLPLLSELKITNKHKAVKIKQKKIMTTPNSLMVWTAGKSTTTMRDYRGLVLIQLRSP